MRSPSRHKSHNATNLPHHTPFSLSALSLSSPSSIASYHTLSLVFSVLTLDAELNFDFFIINAEHLA